MSRFDRFFMHCHRISKYWPLPTSVLAHEKLYVHGFVKKRNGHKHCAKSRAKTHFDRFFMHRLEILKYWPLPTYYLMRSRMSMVSLKNTMVMNFVQSRVSIGF
ncbi:hypothetical protein BHE74_00039291 [Ensete ventricosum]|nr:hypothetical protein BHE74_00039291 [Ensete ventricosum]